MIDPTDHGHPVGGVDYPRTIQEFDEWFPNEDACAAYLLRLRWPDGFVCPVCGGTKGWFDSSARDTLCGLSAADLGDCRDDL